MATSLTSLVDELKASNYLELKPGATPRYRKRGRVSWGQLRHRQALNRIAQREANPRVCKTTIDHTRAQAALTQRTRKDLPRNQQRTMFEKVVLFS